MPRTFNDVEASIAQLHTSWAGLTTGEGPFRQGGNVVLAIAVQSNLAALIVQAKNIRDSAGFATVSADHQADVTDMIAEMELALGEIDDAIHPDNVWASLPHAHRKRLVEGVTLDESARLHLNARAKLQKKGQAKRKAK